MKLKMGMIGGGAGAFIGAIHRIAAAMDGQIDLVCGAFSSDHERSQNFGSSLFLQQNRCYGSYQDMLQKEADLPVDERMDFVCIVTPNHLHFPIAKDALEFGFHVMSDKPATFNLAEALELKNVIERSGLCYGLTHTYTGYPLIKQARHLVTTGELGGIVKIVVEYSQGWLASSDDEHSKQASWRLDPQRSGISCCMGDIGVHAANLTEYVSGLKIAQLCADLESTLAGRTLDDDGVVLVKFDSGAKGILLASQIALGDENNLKLRIYGDKKSLEWSQLEPNSLLLKSNVMPTQIIRTGVGEFCDTALASMRTPAGHPEGYLEAFANIYFNFAKMLRAVKIGQKVSNEKFDVPGIEEAIRGMAFIENVVGASQSEQKWHPFKLNPMLL